MKRQDMTTALAGRGEKPWDMCIIGGGATGLGVAVDAASRGFSTLLLEQYDFAKGTSSRATKLVHGGVRYLQQGNVKLVTEALHERGILRRNAPHLVKDQSFIVPNYKWWEGSFYGIGLKVYDWMAGSLGLGKSRSLSREETLALAPTLDGDGLRGGVLYHDGQFDDARLAIELAKTAAEQGAIVLNYCRVDEFLKENGRIIGVKALDTITGEGHMIYSKTVINATGVFTDSILKKDDAASESIITPSQGVHLVLDKEFLPGDAAILIPHTDDGRVLFAVPWHNKIIAGTTDTLVDRAEIEPRALPAEIDFILQQIGKYLKRDPGYGDIRSVYAGLRPLVKSSGRKTAELARDHLVMVSESGLITITGGKWTTYRRMAEDTVDTAIARGSLPERDCRTATLSIHGAEIGRAPQAEGRLWSDGENDPLHLHGTDAAAIRALAEANPEWARPLHPGLPYIMAEIVWAVREELCMTVEDALSRRTRSLLLDARAAMACSEAVAALLAKELNRDLAWQRAQVEEFERLASGYLVKSKN
jgi:glycerol-3-phosphate dehydrogenase